MKTFADPMRVPRGGWQWTHPQTGHAITAPSLSLLMGRVRTFLAVNGHEIPADLNQQIVDQICARVPDYCINTDPPTPAEMAAEFSKAMWRWGRQGFRVVEKDAMDERRAICETCQFWNGESAFGYGRCNKCGCTGLKLFLPNQSCPIGKWGPKP